MSIWTKNRRAFLLRRLHSLSGIVPLGIFLVLHLWTNSRALLGREAFDGAIAEFESLPYLPILEAVFILGPLAFHALYGIKLAFEGKSNVRAYPHNRNWMYTLQRITGLIALGFIVYHLWHVWGQKASGQLEPDQFYPKLCADLSSTSSGVPIIGLVYVLGIAATVFHFANGLWGFCFKWGIVTSQRSQQRLGLAFGLFGLVLFLVGANTAVFFATGSQFAFMSEARAQDARCVPRTTSPAEPTLPAGETLAPNADSYSTIEGDADATPDASASSEEAP